MSTLTLNPNEDDELDIGAYILCCMIKVHPHYAARHTAAKCGKAARHMIRGFKMVSAIKSNQVCRSCSTVLVT